MNSLFPIETNWPVLTLGDLCKGKGASIQTGPFGSQLHASDYVENGTPCVMPTDIKDGRIDTGSIARITNDDLNRLHRFQLQEGDIVYPRRGDISKRALITKREEGWLCGTGCLRIRANFECVDAKFLSYQLSHSEVCNYLELNAIGATMPHLNTGLASSIPIVCPDLSEQREIAAILGALDDKIELNRKMAATLEEMARALYRSWFVDFDPVHAKTAGRKPAHMNEATAALFPDRFGDDGLPAEWERNPLQGLAQVTMGLSPKGSTYNEKGDGIPLCNGPVEYGEFFLRQIKWTTAPTRLSQRGELIICVRGSTTGRHAFADTEYCLGRGVAGIRGLNDSQEFVETALLSDMERLLEKTTGSVFPSLAKNDLSLFDLINPGKDLIKEFCRQARPIRGQIWQRNIENQTLANLRDALLPRLMSGELRVGEAKERVEDAL